MASSSIFITATEARQNPIRESVIHDEARAIESAILDAVKNGFYQATLSSGSPMTGYNVVSVPVIDINLDTNALYVPSHQFKTGDIVTLTSTDVLPSPLVSTSYYFVIYIDADHIKLALTQSDATNSRPINIDFTLGIVSVTMNNRGRGYLTTPSVYIDPPLSGKPATAAANLSTYAMVDSVGVITPGSGYVDIPTVEISARGSNATAGFIYYKAVSATIAFGGTGYRVNDLLMCYPGTGGSTYVTVTQVDVTGKVLAIAFGGSHEFASLVTYENIVTDVYPLGGSGCTLNLSIGISSIRAGSGGFGYVSPPLVTITSASGEGATAEAIINAGSVVGFTVTSSGSGYKPDVSGITVSLTSGSGATAYAVLQPTGVGSISIINNGNGSYLSAPAVELIAQGSGVTLTEVTMMIVAASISNAGGGYTRGDILLIAGGGGTDNATIQVTKVGSLGEILSYTLITSGSYHTLPILNNNSVIGGTGKSATFNLRAGLESILINSGGTGYVSPPTVVITPVDGNGNGAAAYTIIEDDYVTNIVVKSAGTGYTNIPNILITSGTGATAEAIINSGSITEIIVTSSGANYTSPPIVNIEGAGTAYATLKPTGIARIEVTNIGENYSSAPEVQVIPNPNHVTIPVQPSTVVNLGYSVETVSVIDSGSGYGPVGADIRIEEPTGVHKFPATAIASSGFNTGTMVISLYQNSRDYYKVWKNQAPSDSLYTRPYQDRMDTVIAYFTNLGYTINRQTNPATGNTIQWTLMW